MEGDTPEFKWTQERITEWHKQAFPNATLASQLVKLNEEVNELDTAEDKREHEIADVFICAIVLLNRFECKLGFLAINGFIGALLGTLKNQQEAEAYINGLIAEKMDVNEKRTWVETEPGFYRHKEEEADAKPTEP